MEALEPWNPATLKRWNLGISRTLELWKLASRDLERWGLGTMEPWNAEALDAGNLGNLETLEPCNPGTLELWNLGISGAGHSLTQPDPAGHSPTQPEPAGHDPAGPSPTQADPPGHTYKPSHFAANRTQPDW